MRIKQAALALVAAVAAAGPVQADVRATIDSAFTDLQAARRSGDRIRTLTAARRMAAAAPDNPVIRTFLARFAAAAGDQALAVETLTWLADRGYGVDARARPDLKHVLSAPGNRNLVRRLDANLRAVGGVSGLAPISGGLDSEGVDYDSRRDRLYVADASGVYAVGADGTAELVGGGEALKDRFVLGVRRHPKGDNIFVCSSARPDTGEKAAELVVIDAADPRRVERFDLGPSSGTRLCNDVAVLDDGAAITDTNTGEVLRYRFGGGVERFGRTLFTYPNGAVRVGDVVVVADLLGLWALDLNGNLLGPLRGEDGAYIGGMDGLAADGHRLYGVQNLTAPARVVSFRLGSDLVLRDRRVIASALPELQGMTTATLQGDEIVVLSRPAGATEPPPKALVRFKAR